MIETQWFAGIVALLSLLSSGAALFVSMKVKYEIATFKNDFLREIDSRYVRKEEFDRTTRTMEREAGAYQQRTTDDMSDIKVEVRRDRDNLQITLNGILAKLNKQNG